MDSENRKIIFQKSVIKKPGTKVTNVVKPQPTISNFFDDEDDQVQPIASKNAEKDITKSYGSSITLKRSVKELNRALEEDSTVFEYDAVYEKIAEKKSAANNNSSNINANLANDQKEQPKYMEAILKTAAMRKRENDRRMERKIQKERETEDPELADKEVFVTETYRKKLEERQEEDELLRQREEFDEDHAAAKQNNMAQFYRHLVLNQRMVCDEELKVKTSESLSFAQRTKKNINIRERVDSEEDSENESNIPISDNKIDFLPSSPLPLSQPEDINEADFKSVAESNNLTHESTTDTKIESVIEEIPIVPKKSLGIHIYDKRNTEESIAAAQLRYLERKQSSLLYHYLLAGIDDDD